MTTDNLKRAVGTFPTRQNAEAALMELRDVGFNMDKISAIAQNARSLRYCENGLITFFESILRINFLVCLYI